MKAGKMLHGDSDNNRSENAVRCDDECSALQQPMQHAASGIAPQCTVKVKSVLAGSEKWKVKSEKGWRGDVWCIAIPAPA